MVGQINADLKCLIEWSTRYCLTLYPASLKLILFGLKYFSDRCTVELDNVKIKIDSESVDVVDEARSLGSCIDYMLTVI